MADPLKLQIRDHVVTSLQAVLKASGYYTNAGTNVHAPADPITKVTTFPYLGVDIGLESPDNICAGLTYRSQQDFIIKLYVKSSDPDGDLLKLEADVKKALLSGPTRGGLAISTEFREETPNLAALTASGLGDMDAYYVVLFSWSPTAP